MVWPIQQQQPNNHIMQSRGPNGGPQEPNPQHMIQRFLPSQNTQNELSPDRIGGLTKKLNNVQQVLKVVQSAAPIVQQYAPMAKNLPMMFKLMKALNEDDNSEKQVESVEESQPIDKTDMGNQQSENVKEDVGQSTPKLYI